MVVVADVVEEVEVVVGRGEAGQCFEEGCVVVEAEPVHPVMDFGEVIDVFDEPCSVIICVDSLLCLFYGEAVLVGVGSGNGFVPNLFVSFVEDECAVEIKTDVLWMHRNEHG